MTETKPQGRPPLILGAVLVWAFGVGTGLFFGLSYSAARQPPADTQLVMAPPLPPATVAPRTPRPTATPGEWVRPMHIVLGYPCSEFTLEEMRVKDGLTARSVQLTFRASNTDVINDCRVSRGFIVLRSAEGRSLLAAEEDLAIPSLTARKVQQTYSVPNDTEIAKLVIGDLTRPKFQMDLALVQRTP